MKTDNVAFFKVNFNNGKLLLNSSPSMAIAIVIIYILFERFFIQLGAPSIIIYLNDVIIIYLAIKIATCRSWKRFWPMVVGYIAVVFLSILVAIPNYSIWGGNIITTIIEIRNILRFLIFFISCVTFLNEIQIKAIFKCLISYFYVNALFIVYQYLTYHPTIYWTRGDQMNGFFGTMTGGNIFVNTLLLVTVTYLLNRWVKNKIRLIEFLIPFTVSIVIAGMIELKAYFIEIIVLYVWYLITKKKSYREVKMNLIIIISIAAVIIVSLNYMYQEYPWFREAMSIKGMINSITSEDGYTGAGDLNRFTGIYTIAKNIFEYDFMNVLFGIGLGNASPSTLGNNGSIFFQTYETTHYSWFSGTYTFVQCGLIGVILYICLFIYLSRKRKTCNSFSLASELMAIISIFLIFYNETLKTDAGYLVFFTVASGFITHQSKEICVEDID